MAFFLLSSLFATPLPSTTLFLPYHLFTTKTYASAKRLEAFEDSLGSGMTVGTVGSHGDADAHARGALVKGPTQPNGAGIPTLSSSQQQSPGVLVSMRNCSFRYENANADTATPPVLSGLDFTVERGKLTVVVGPVGAGKSVSLRPS